VRSCMTGVALLGLAAILLLGVGSATFARPTFARPLALRTGVTPAPAGGAAAQHLERAPAGGAAQGLERTLATAQSADVPLMIRVSDQEATAALADALASIPDAPRVDNPQVAFRGGRVHLTGTLRDTPVALPLAVVGRVEVRDGQLVPVVERIDSGRFPLPGAVSDRIAEAVASADELNQYLEITVTGVEVADGYLTVTGRPKHPAK
jgi:hypothetical protein